MNMRRVVDLLFEALMLNRIPRSGYSFLGAGKESVAEHSFSTAFIALIIEFNAGESLEARLAKDADQLSLALNLKALQDIGHTSPAKWIPHVQDRLKTATGKKLMASILNRNRDSWWLEHYNDNNVTNS